jgi:2-methylcitrate dehydratase PrpD
VPATIATAEEGDCNGKEAIVAIVAGYDIMARTYSAAPGIAPRFRPTPVFGPFGAAAAAGKLLKLDGYQLTSALGFAANFSSGFTEGWTSGTSEIRLQPGVASRNGIMAALLAGAGGTAAETTLEGDYGFYRAFVGSDYDLEPLTAGLGETYLIKNTKSKQYPI